MKRNIIVSLALALSLCCGAQCINVPTPAVSGTEKVCHKAYTIFYDSKLEIPRLVVYELTGPHSLGCIPRASGFHSELDSAKPDAYSGTGYDLGHMSPAQDNAWDQDVSHDSFSMLNIAPQLPGLNRMEWERLEETIRAWALERGDLLIYVGPIVSPDDKKINNVDVPIAFFKIVVDRKTGDVLAFEMPQKDIAKGDINQWRITVSELRQQTSIMFTFTQAVTAPLWNTDLVAWRKAHKDACGR